MSIGYACLALCVFHSDYRTIRLDHFDEKKLNELIIYNLESLDRIIDYNIENEIHLFRISSDLIPFGSNPVNQLQWWDIYKDKFQTIGTKIKKHNIRVSMHPGQYTLLNSPNEEVVKRSIFDLMYHALVLDSLEVDDTCKIVLHIGGVYGDKQEAMNRFVTNFHNLPLSIKRRLIIENDDRNYNIEEVLSISEQISIPVVFDNLHHYLNPPSKKLSEVEWIHKCKMTWKDKDGKQKVHYSEQDRLKQAGSHSFTINLDLFLKWYESLNQSDLDIMLEVKDKNISAIKISNCINHYLKNHHLEKAWERYKYQVLEHSPQMYLQIRGLLKDKDDLKALDFYHLIDAGLDQELHLGNQVNAIKHIWDYFKDLENEKHQFLKRLEKVKDGTLTINAMKNYLYNLALKNQNQYLISSYYFILERKKL